MGWGAAVGMAAGQTAGNLLGENAAREDATTSWNRQLFMANNAMQMRMEDLKKAGVNPMLAASGGMSGVGMTTSAPTIQTQNIGQGISQAAMTGAQIAQTNASTDLTKAQADKTRWETGDQWVPFNDKGEPDWDRAGGGVMGNLNAKSSWQNTENLKQTYNNIIQQTKSGEAQQNLTQVQKQIQDLNLQQQRQLYDVMVRKAGADMGIAEANAKDMESLAKITGNPTWGPIIKLFRAIFPGGARL